MNDERDPRARVGVGKQTGNPFSSICIHTRRGASQNQSEHAYIILWRADCVCSTRLFSVVTVIDVVSAAILPVWVDFTSLKGLPCAPGPATTRRGMLVTNG